MELALYSSRQNIPKKHLPNMKPFNFSSPYSRIGFFLAAAVCAGALLLKGDKTPEVDVYVLDNTSPAERLPWKLVEPPAIDFEDFDPGAADIPNFRDHAANALFGEAKVPCFEVKIDPSVPGADIDYRTDMFSGSSLVTSEAFAEALKLKMSEAFKDEVWARDAKCFAGSFVVSFSVTESGYLGSTMLVHHLRGQSFDAGHGVLDVLRSLDREGIRWHDGTKGAGEVRIPISFKLV